MGFGFSGFDFSGFDYWGDGHHADLYRDKCIRLRIKDVNVPPKFIVPIENATLKNHNSYKNGLENIKL